MNKFTKMLGVTLLEIMLVLAIAAMVIVMSVRYYQTASAGQQANSMLQMIQAIASSADGLAQGTGSYSGQVNSAAIAPLMPSRSLTTPWGGTVTFGTADASTYTVTFTAVPAAVCAQVKSRLKGNPKYTAASVDAITCPTDGTPLAAFTYTYDASL